VGGVGNALEWPALISLVQQLTPPSLHGRLMGAVESLSALCLAIGLPLGGALVALTSTRAAFAVAGAGTLATTAAFVRLTRVGLERRQSGEAEAPPELLGGVPPEPLSQPEPLLINEPGSE
jgi:MFS family permease